ncbi:hypothetical protein B0H67DRAFT_548159 [Lasiosphaeris hirsuta]|uniref:Uncharacterized protein n=1 Tax=Lasiosphaeris hirsuta TaxID=260670 RepID=A0AA40B9I8_9PEZI|nr:hypothetical protein B0H67DRAFT_548159 [Lasiosphaeris hirsuta]
MADTYKYFGLSCPSGGSFYICQGNTTEFIGCCTTDPCTAAYNGRCPAANLRASSFSADSYTDLPRQDCDDDKSFEIWYTCKFNKPPFMGCCASNPCASGSCAAKDLRPAKLSAEPDLRANFLRADASASTTSASPTASGTSTATAATAVPALSGSTGLSGGAIGGIVVGAAVIVVIVVAAVMYKCGWHARRKKERLETAVPTGMAYHDGSASLEPPMTAGLGIKSGVYRDSYLSGTTGYNQYPSPRQDGSYLPSYDAKGCPSQQFQPSPQTHQGHFSYAPDSYSNGNSGGAVELPVAFPAVQELPAEGPTPANHHHHVSLMPSSHSGPSTPLTVTPISSPRVPDGQQWSADNHHNRI